MKHCLNCNDELVRHRYPSRDGRTKGPLETIKVFENRDYCRKPECRELAYSNRRPTRGYPAKIPTPSDRLKDYFNFELLVDLSPRRHP